MNVDLVPPLDPQRLSAFLRQAEWRVSGGREGVYHRMLAPGAEIGDRNASILIPLDSDAPDFGELMQQASLDLRHNHTDLWNRVIAPQSHISSADSLKFRRESAAPSGLIPWKQGQVLVEAARATLAAGAKAFMEPARQYSNRYGSFANRYLDKVLMGQTAVGSYVVTALVPAAATISLHGNGLDGTGIVGPDTAHGRQVTTAVSVALDAAVSSIEDYRSTFSTEAFIENVRYGVSYELVDALAKLSGGSEEAEVSVEWSSYTETTLIQSAVPERSEFVFSPADATVLELVANELVLSGRPERVSVRGRVHLLTRKVAGGPGVVGIDAGDRKFRARFDSEEDYHQAVRAHDDEFNVEVAGDLSREGTVSWLYRARLTRVFADPASPRSDPGLFDSSP